MQRKVGEIVANAARLKALQGGALHMGAPLGFTLPGFDKDAHASIIERLVQLVPEAAVFGQSLGDQLFLGSAKRRLLAGLGGGDGDDGQRRV